jgi:catechol 2,3-dioxygenase-like lactoylglutathione lyase family enzyme
LAIAIGRLDHFVLTVRDSAATIAFYTRVLGLEVRRFGPEGRVASHYGRAKINLHEAARSSWVRSRAAARRGRFVRSIVAIPTAI